MKYVGSLQEKVTLIRKQFKGLLGQRISGYELAELWSESDRRWSPWRDLPVVLTFESGASLSISWSKFDDLGIEKGRVLPFSLSGCTVRWVSEGTPDLDNGVGYAVESIALASGEMSTGRTVEIWTHLYLRLSNGGALDIYNALDENGFSFVEGQIQPGTANTPLRIKECL